MEDAGVFVAEALTVRNHAKQQLLVQSQRADGGEQPAVSWKRVPSDVQRSFQHTLQLRNTHSMSVENPIFNLFLELLKLRRLHMVNRSLCVQVTTGRDTLTVWCVSSYQTLIWFHFTVNYVKFWFTVSLRTYSTNSSYACYSWYHRIFREQTSLSSCWRISCRSITNRSEQKHTRCFRLLEMT